MQKYGGSDGGFMPDHAQRMQHRARNIALKRKEEYLGARVPKGLKERVLNQAREQGIPVSLLIRRVLEEVFTEGAKVSIGNSTNTPTNESLVEQTDMRFKDVIGWKSFELNRNAICCSCNASMSTGGEAHIAIMPSQSQLLIVCGTCKKTVQS